MRKLKADRRAKTFVVDESGKRGGLMEVRSLHFMQVWDTQTEPGSLSPGGFRRWQCFQVENHWFRADKTRGEGIADPRTLRAAKPQ